MHPVTRRTLIIGAVGAAGAAGVAAGVPVAAAAHGTPSDTAKHSDGQPKIGASAADAAVVRSDYTHLVGERFTATAAGTAHSLVLTGVSDLQPIATPDDENRFSLIFSVEHSVPAQDTYALRGAGAPDALLFIAPVGPASGRTVEAVVNRIA